MQGRDEHRVRVGEPGARLGPFHRAEREEWLVCGIYLLRGGRINKSMEVVHTIPLLPSGWSCAG